MRKVILFIASSLDGFIASSDGSVDWLFTDQDYGYKRFYRSIDTVLMGRKTYAQMMRLWGYQYSGKKGYVFTRSRRPKVNKHVEFVSENIPKFVRDLRKRKGKDIWLVGGAEIATILLNARLIDRIDLFIHPIIVGRGIPLFHAIKPLNRLTFMRKKSFDSGLIQLSYRIKV